MAPSNDSEEATLAVGTAPPQVGICIVIFVILSNFLSINSNLLEVQKFNFVIQQGEVIAGNNPAASDVAVTIDRAITDGAMNDATALSQVESTTLLLHFFDWYQSQMK